MRTALFLLLALAIAAVPGSLVPQRSADPNGVVQYFRNNPTLAPILDRFQVFDTYTSVWFSSIYILLFVSLVGCVIPRTVHHFRSLRTAPPKTPSRLSRMSAFDTREVPVGSKDRAGEHITASTAVAAARAILRRRGYRVALFEGAQTPDTSQFSVSAERGYLREAGNLVFHIALLGILVAVGIGGGFGYTGQRVVPEGQSMINTLAAYDSFNPGRFFKTDELSPYSITLNKLSVTYETKNPKGLGIPIDYTARVTTKQQDLRVQKSATIKVNEPLSIDGTSVYLLGNGYAPRITVRNPSGQTVFSDPVPFLPQDANLTSLGVVKIPDGLAKQVGMIGFLYPTKVTANTGAFTSSYPDALNPVLTLNAFSGDLGINNGSPKSVYALDTSKLTQLNGGQTGVRSIELKPGQTQQLPGGLGSVTFEGATRFASFEIHHDPAQGWVLFFALCAFSGLIVALLIPRRRLWVKAIDHADKPLRLEYAGLARGDDPQLEAVVEELVTEHIAALGLSADHESESEPAPEQESLVHPT
jgi:cytochrome c biogenesis protein